MISQPQEARCEIKAWLRKGPFAAKWFRSPIVILCENFHSCETTPWHTSAISQPLPSFRSYEMLCEIPKALRIPFSQPWPHFAVGFAAAKPPLGTRVSFRSCEMGCENAPPLRNWPPAAKTPLCCENSNHPLTSIFKRYKFQISFLNRSFELPFGAKEEPSPSTLPSDPHLSLSRAHTSDYLLWDSHGKNLRS